MLVNKRTGRMQSDRDRQGNWHIVSDKAMIHGPSHSEGHERPGLGDGRGHDDKLDESSTMPGLQTPASTLDGPDQNSSGTSPSLPPSSYFLAAFRPRCCYFWGCLGDLPLLPRFLTNTRTRASGQSTRSRHRDRERRQLHQQPKPNSAARGCRRPCHLCLGAGHPSSTINARAQITDARCRLLTRSRQARPAWRGHHTTFRAGRPALSAPSPPSPIPRAPGPGPGPGLYKDCDPGTVTRHRRR